MDTKQYRYITLVYENYPVARALEEIYCAACSQILATREQAITITLIVEHNQPVAHEVLMCPQCSAHVHVYPFAAPIALN